MTLDGKFQKVKHQLMDYNYYKAVERELERKIKTLDERLSSGGVRAVSSELRGGSHENNWIVETVTEQDALVKRLNGVRVILKETNEWLDSLIKYQKQAVELYVIKNNCKNVECCTVKLGLSHSMQLIRVVDDSINSIIENFEIY